MSASKSDRVGTSQTWEDLASYLRVTPGSDPASRNLRLCPELQPVGVERTSGHSVGHGVVGSEGPALFQALSSCNVVTSRGEQLSQDLEGPRSDKERNEMGTN